MPRSPKPPFTSLPIAFRVYPVRRARRARAKNRRRPVPRPDAMLVFDTETRIDETQRLTCGSYCFLVRGRCLEEGFFYADDLPAAERTIMRRYVERHRPKVADDGVPQLLLLTQREFLAKLYRVAYEARGLVSGFNSPFDLSRLATSVTSARAPFAGGFSFTLWTYQDRHAGTRKSPFCPRLAIKHIDSKRSLIGLTGVHEPDPLDQIPEGSSTGTPDPFYVFQGHFLDLRRLAYALTDKGYTLASACEAFGVEEGKQDAPPHGVITARYLDYSLADARATAALAEAVLREYDRHDIALSATRAFSPAAIGKAYLRGMGIAPVLERQPDFPPHILGYAQSAFYGGRTSAHIRNVPVPVVYTDFLSMYPTVNCLLGLWRYVIAARIRVVEHCKAEIQTLLEHLTPEALFVRETWSTLVAFVRIVPDSDVLPSRGQYSRTHDWQVGLNHLYATGTDAEGGLWYALPDVVASVLLTGRIPRIIDAFRLEADGLLPTLTPTALRGVIPIDPRTDDFFQVVVEERKRLDATTDGSPDERARLKHALKVLANSASFGIYAEMRREDTVASIPVTCHGIDRKPYLCDVAHPDDPGEYCFPPLASLITAAARLMLALLEHAVTALGGTYAMEDTDSMAIVATEHGGLIPCAGGLHRLEDGRDAVRALSWTQVEDIRDRFASLNPYDPTAVKGSVLKIEDDHWDPHTKQPRIVYCLAISAKRYVLFVLEVDGTPTLLRKDVNNHEDRWSEHGLGHLMNPSDPTSDDRAWIGQEWLRLVRDALGLPTKIPAYAARPAVGRITVSSPAVLQPLSALNRGKTYADQIKPFNFLITCHVRPFGHPLGADPEHFHLIAPFETDPARWTRMAWIDQYSGERYRITARGDHGTRRMARVKTYGEVLEDYRWHPEAKCADAQGNPCGKATIGLLQRRHVRVGEIRFIGKESNNLEEVDAGLVHASSAVYTEYPDPRRDHWDSKVRPLLKRVSLKVFEQMTGKDRRVLIDARTGRRRTRTDTKRLLIAVLKRLELL